MEDILMDLMAMHDVLHEYADSIARLLGVDVVIANNKLESIVNTIPSYSERTPITVNSVLGSTIRSGQVMKVRNRKNYYGCKSCPAYKTCPISGMIAVPILYNNNSIGGILLSIPSHKINDIFDNVDNTINFLFVIAEFIATKFYVQELNEKLNRVIEAKQFLMEGDTDIVIGVNHTGFIVSFNQAAAKLLSPGDTPEGQFIGNVLPIKSIIDFLKNEIDIVDKPVIYQKDGQNQCGFLSCKRIFSNGIHIGNIIILRRISNVKDIFASYLNLLWSPLSFEALTKQGLISDDVIWRYNELPLNVDKILIEGNGLYSMSQVAGAIHYHKNRNSSLFAELDCNECKFAGFINVILDENTGDISPWGDEFFNLIGNGTLYFHSIEHLPLYLQKSLDHLLTEYEKRKGQRSLLLFSVGKPLQELKKQGLIEEHLYRRLSREQTLVLDDTQIGVEQCISNSLIFYSGVHRKPIPEFTSKAQKKLELYVRQNGLDLVRRVLEILIARQDQQVMVTVEDLEPLLPNTDVTAPNVILSQKQLEAKHIRQMLANHVPKKEIAYRLSISRSTLYRRIKELENEED